MAHTVILRMTSGDLAIKSRQPCASWLTNIFVVIVTIIFASVANSIAAAPANSLHPRPFVPLPPPEVKSRGAILIDAETGRVLWAHNPNRELPMASTTKLMTAILFCEHVSPDTIIVAGADAANTHECSMHLKVGEKVTAHDLLRAMLLRSANDSAVAAADAVAGSVPQFVKLMNIRARQMGCTRTHFANPNGLPAPDHYTTAHDLAIIAAAAMRVPRIRNVVRLLRARIHRSIDKQDEIMVNHTHFVGHFPGADGVKTGWTDAAGHCLVGSDTRGGWELISVVLHSPNFVKETESIMDYGFHNFERKELLPAGATVATYHVAGGTASTVSAIVTRPLYVVVPRAAKAPVRFYAQPGVVQAPVTAGKFIAVGEAMQGGTDLATVSLAAASTVDLPPTSSPVRPTMAEAIRLLLTSALVLVSLVYGIRITSAAQSARRRRRGIEAGLRSDDRAGPRYR